MMWSLPMRPAACASRSNRLSTASFPAAAEWSTLMATRREMKVFSPSCTLPCRLADQPDDAIFPIQDLTGL